MEEKQLVVVEEQKNVFTRAIKNFSKSITVTNGGFKHILIAVKRHQVIKSFIAYKNISKVVDEEKRERITRRYEKTYVSYLSELDDYIKNFIYPKVKANKGQYEENKIIEEYFVINNLKEKDHMEYKYKRQRFLIETDFRGVLKTNNIRLLENYKHFFVYKMDNIYKTLLRTYSIKMIEKNNNEEKYNEMFKELDEYISQVLPYKIEIDGTEAYKNIVEEHKKLQKYKYDMYLKDKMKYIEKNMLLLSISRDLFAHSLPLVTAEQCYIKLLKESRQQIILADNFNKKEEAYKLLIDLIELYNVKLLSKKTYWDDPKTREEYKKFWSEYQRIQKLKLIDLNEYTRQKESLFIYYDLRLLNRITNEKYSEIKKYYRIKLRELKALKVLKNSYVTLEGKYKLNTNKVW